jgi:hypothetical protein
MFPSKPTPSSSSFPATVARRSNAEIWGGFWASFFLMASMCLDGSLDPVVVCGKIVVCDRDVNSHAAKGDVVRRTGGVGMVLANGAFDGEGLVADCHVLPATAVGAATGDRLRKYIASATKQRPATGTILFEGTHHPVRER